MEKIATDEQIAVADAATNLNKVEKYVDGQWIESRMKLIKNGDVVRVFEICNVCDQGETPDAVIGWNKCFVCNGTGFESKSLGEFKARGDAFVHGDIMRWGIEAWPCCPACHETRDVIDINCENDFHKENLT